MVRKPEPTYVLAKDIVIPAGTKLTDAPGRIMRIYPHVEAILENGPDSVSIWNIDLEEGIRTGLVKEQE